MSPLRILTVIQARTGSSRLPGKVLLPLGESCVLVEMWRRVQAAREKGQVAIATTLLPEDDAIAALCERHGMTCFRGHPDDLLDRHYRVMCDWDADVVVKIPSDCPLIDPAVIDAAIAGFFAGEDGYDYFSNLHPPTFPDGNDVEVMSAVALETAWRDARRAIDREHTTPFLWDNPERFSIGNLRWATGLDFSRSHRWVLDYPEDYQVIRAVFDELAPVDPLFGLDAIVALLDRRPDIGRLNRRYHGDGWYLRHANELKTYGGDVGTH